LRTGVVSATRLRGIGGTVKTKKEGGPMRMHGISNDIDQCIRRGWIPGNTWRIGGLVILVVWFRRPTCVGPYTSLKGGISIGSKDWTSWCPS
jgi:hypothetical protein